MEATSSRHWDTNFKWHFWECRWSLNSESFYLFIYLISLFMLMLRLINGMFGNWILKRWNFYCHNKLYMALIPKGKAALQLMHSIWWAGCRETPFVPGTGHRLQFAVCHTDRALILSCSRRGFTNERNFLCEPATSAPSSSSTRHPLSLSSSIRKV